MTSPRACRGEEERCVVDQVFWSMNWLSCDFD